MSQKRGRTVIARHVGPLAGEASPPGLSLLFLGVVDLVEEKSIRRRHGHTILQFLLHSRLVAMASSTLLTLTGGLVRGRFWFSSPRFWDRNFLHGTLKAKSGGGREERICQRDVTWQSCCLGLEDREGLGRGRGRGRANGDARCGVGRWRGEGERARVKAGGERVELGGPGNGGCG